MGDRRPTVLIVGSGYAGFHCARSLERRLPPDAADIVLASPIDYLLYTSLLPQVAAGLLEPRHLAVGLRDALSRTELALGHIVDVDLDRREVVLLRDNRTTTTVPWDRLVLGPGAVTRTLDIPGVKEHAHGVKSLAEAVALRDHVLRELEHADAAEEPDARARCCTFLVVGAGYTGTELAAQLQSVTREAIGKYPRLRGHEPHWILLDVADRVLSGLPAKLGTDALRVLRDRGVDVRLKTSVRSATGDAVFLSDGSQISTHTLVWTTGVTPSPLIEPLGLPTQHGRLTVDAQFRVSGRSDVFAFGDAAAVPDLTKDEGMLTAQTAQHAQRQGRAAARNVAASLGRGTPRRYKHRDLGFVVDLGGLDAVANPLGVPLTGPLAAAVTRGYHLLALPTNGKRVRVAADWLLGAVLPPQLVQLGFVPVTEWTVPAAEKTDIASQWHCAAHDIPRRLIAVSDRALPDSRT